MTYGETETKWFACEACGEQVTWAKTRKGTTYLAGRLDWQGDEYGAQRVYKPSHYCRATEEEKAAAAARRAEAKEQREAAKLLYEKEQFFAEAGTKFELEGEITFIKERETAYGITTTIEFAAEGRGFTWYASGARMTEREELAAGDKIKIAGTVKGQQEKYGKIRTIVTRCKIAVTEKAVQPEIVAEPSRGQVAVQKMIDDMKADGSPAALAAVAALKESGAYDYIEF